MSSYSSRIEVKSLETAELKHLEKRIAALGIFPKKLMQHELFYFDQPFTDAELKKIEQALFTGPFKRVSVSRTLQEENIDWVLTLKFKPGVTDNLGHTTSLALRDLLGKKMKVSSAKRYLFSGITKEEVEKLAHELLYNPLIQDIVIQEDQDHQKKAHQIDFNVLQRAISTIKTYDLSGRDEELLEISQKGCLALTLIEMKAVRDHFFDQRVLEKRVQFGLKEITDVELECIAQTWSEHCYHKVFRAKIDFDGEKIDSLFKTYIKKVTYELDKPYLISVFDDNAGVVRYFDSCDLAYKIETHNSPSALDPYGGALTGILGVDRDILGTGMGAEPLAHVMAYCLGDPEKDQKIPGLLSLKRLREGIHEGVIDGGNQSGIPLMRGLELFDTSFSGKPLVFCGSIGKLPPKVLGKPSHQKIIEPDDLVFMVGGRVGKDGIHGATFSSVALTDSSPTSAVQIGDPITQKKMTDFILAARDLGLYRAITDNGAGGLSSSCVEMAREAGGLKLDLAKVPLKYPGLEPWEIFLSESQERMTVSLNRDQKKDFVRLAKKYDVEVTEIGTFTKEKFVHLTYGEKTVAYLSMDFLFEGCPAPTLKASWQKRVFDEPSIHSQDVKNLMLDLMKSPNIRSKEHFLRSYDHEVKGLSVVKLLAGEHADVPPDGAVMMVDYDSFEGIVLSEGINPYYSEIDTHSMAEAVVDLAVRRVLVTGGDITRLAGLDNFCWPKTSDMPDAAYKLAQLVRAAKGLYEACKFFEVPLISGKDSMANDCTKVSPPISILPTLLFSVIAPIDHVKKALTLDPKKAGDLVYLLGNTYDELGASEIFRVMGGPIGNLVPCFRKEETSYYAALSHFIALEKIESAHALAMGGLGVGLSLMVIASDRGMQIQLDQDLFVQLFSESLSRILVTVTKENQPEFEKVFGVKPIGQVTEERVLKINEMSFKIDELKKRYQCDLKR